MKKKVFLYFFGIISILMMTGCSNKEYYITDNDFLYDEAIQYIIDSDDSPEKSNERYKMFTDFNGFGITKDNNYRYVYMWIFEESYYVVDRKIISGSGSSMPYKFTFDLTNNIVIQCEVPKDGNRYVNSIKEMYPDDLENKAIHYIWKDDSLINKVREYYSDLNDQNIYFYTGEEYIKLDK